MYTGYTLITSGCVRTELIQVVWDPSARLISWAGPKVAGFIAAACEAVSDYTLRPGSLVLHNSIRDCEETGKYAE